MNIFLNSGTSQGLNYTPAMTAQRCSNKAQQQTYDTAHAGRDKAIALVVRTSCPPTRRANAGVKARGDPNQRDELGPVDSLPDHVLANGFLYAGLPGQTRLAVEGQQVVSHQAREEDLEAGVLERVPEI